MWKGVKLLAQTQTQTQETANNQGNKEDEWKFILKSLQ